MDDENVRIGKSHPAVLCDNLRIIPLGDLPGKNVRDRLAGEIERAGETGNVISDDDRAHHGREMKDRSALGVREFLVAHRPVGGAEIDGLFRQLSDAAARADRLVVDFDPGALSVVGEPLRINGIRERRACSG